MPNLYAPIRVEQGTREEYLSLDSYDDNTIYFLTDSHQVFVGSEEYTSSVHELDELPTEEVEGEDGRIYYHPESESTYIYLNGKWNIIFDKTKAIQKITVGDGLETESEDGTIVTDGTISHYVHDYIYADKFPLLYIGNTARNNIHGYRTTELTIPRFKTDKFGHVYGNAESSVLSLYNINGYLRLRGSVDTLDEIDTFELDPREVEAVGEELAEGYLLERKRNSVGCLYYVESEKKYYYWNGEDFRPILAEQDLSSVIDKVEDVAGQVPMFTEEGGLESAGYTALSEVEPGTYGHGQEESEDSIIASIPKITVDKFGRITKAENEEIGFAEKQVAEDLTYFLAETFLVNPLLVSSQYTNLKKSYGKIWIVPQGEFKLDVTGAFDFIVYGSLYSELFGVSIDNKDCIYDEDYYVIQHQGAYKKSYTIHFADRTSSGSHNNYSTVLSSLSAGTHKIQIFCENGTAEGEFIVNDPSWIDVTYHINSAYYVSKDDIRYNYVEKTAKAKEGTSKINGTSEKYPDYIDGENPIYGYAYGRSDDGVYSDPECTQRFYSDITEPIDLYFKLTADRSDLILPHGDGITYENGEYPFANNKYKLTGFVDMDVIGEDLYGVAIDTLAIPIPSKEGYVFGGWYTDQDFSGDQVYDFPQTYPAPDQGMTSVYTTEYYPLWIDENA